LSHSYNSTLVFQADTQQEGRMARRVLSIQVEIKKHQGVSRVKVQTVNSALKELAFEFPFTNLSQIEAAISQELGLSPEYVKTRVRYQIN
jgi:hypothetical protein